LKEVWILSFGAGVNSTALLFWLVKNKKPLDEVIFANTMNEMPETYPHIKKIKEWCEKKNILFTVVKTHLGDGNLREWYLEKKKIPVRIIRSCTDLFKIRPIYKYLKKKHGEVHINCYLGISYEERKRVKTSGRKDRTLLYPLVDNKIDREECKEIIKQNGFEVPVKSGCYFCPFQNKGSWNRLLKNHPELFEESIKFEENGSGFPEYYLGRGMPLRKFKKIIKEQSNLANFLLQQEKDYGEVEQCVYCHL